MRSMVRDKRPETEKQEQQDLVKNSGHNERIVPSVRW